MTTNDDINNIKFLDKTPEKADKADKTYYMSMMVEILGQQQGKDITYSIHCLKLTGLGIDS